MEYLTKQQALDKGYVSYGHKSDDFQRLKKLEHLCDEDFVHGKILVLADTSPSYTPNINPEDIIEMIGDYFHNQMSDETSDDDLDWVYEDIKKIDFNPLSEKLNSLFQDNKYYPLTNIMLIRDGYHQCKYCGAFTSQPDEDCYRAPF